MSLPWPIRSVIAGAAGTTSVMHLPQVTDRVRWAVAVVDNAARRSSQA